MRRRSWILMLLGACTGGERAPERTPTIDAGPAIVERAPVDAAPVDAAPVDAAPTRDASAALPGPVERRVVRARFVAGDRAITACGVVAFIGVYVYEVVEVVDGPPLEGRFVADVLCPDFAVTRGLRFVPGQIHQLTLGPAKRSYAMATPPASPAPELPRFEATDLQP
jgi:hypothetical protein